MVLILIIDRSNSLTLMQFFHVGGAAGGALLQLYGALLRSIEVSRRPGAAADAAASGAGTSTGERPRAAGAGNLMCYILIGIEWQLVDVVL